MAIELQPPSNVHFSDPGEVVTTLYNVGITIAGIVFVILFLVGGIQYLTAAGDTDGTGKAKKLLIDAIIGLILVLSAWAASDFILGQFTGISSTSQGSQPGGSNSGGGSGNGSQSGYQTGPPPTTEADQSPSATPAGQSSGTNGTTAQQTQSPSSVIARLSIYSASRSDFIRDGSVIVAIVENSGQIDERLVVSGMPDNIGGIVLTFSPQPNKTYTLAVVNRATPPKSLKEEIINPSNSVISKRFDIP